MCVRWLATVRSPRNSVDAISRFVRPSATSVATLSSDGLSPAIRARPPILPSSSAPRQTSRQRRAPRSRRAPTRSPHARCASGVRGDESVPRPSSERARPKGSPAASLSRTACSSSSARGGKVPAGRRDKSAAQHRVRQDPFPPEPAPRSLPPRPGPRPGRCARAAGVPLRSPAPSAACSGPRRQRRRRPALRANELADRRLGVTAPEIAGTQDPEVRLECLGLAVHR